MRPGLVALLAAAVLVVGLRTGVAAPVRVTGDSMAPTLRAGDVVLIDKMDRRPARGDLVTFTPPGEGGLSVKRVVGVAGDVVAIRDALLYVDDQLVPESYVDHESIDALYFGPVTVQQDTVLVLGDRRAVSVDSRDYGPVPLADVEGRVVTILWEAGR